MSASISTFTPASPDTCPDTSMQALVCHQFGAPHEVVRLQSMDRSGQPWARTRRGLPWPTPTSATPRAC